MKFCIVVGPLHIQKKNSDGHWASILDEVATGGGKKSQTCGTWTCGVFDCDILYEPKGGIKINCHPWTNYYGVNPGGSGGSP